MRIEIAEPGRMTQTGSSLLKLIQNNNMPVLDLLVRESIQNSLDARKNDSKYVQVEYLTGNFRSRSLCEELEGISDSLLSRFPGNAGYIAVRDSKTVGLTGELDYKKVKNNDYGNLLKLIYEICKPQEAEGAGGSWGLGKTVYFRIGIGLVIYYSRIKTEAGYASRLAASFVENETSPDAMIPEYKGMSKRGIAWWGESTGENITQPVTDEKYISEFLDIFGIPEYSGDETGTTIIIPYIDREKLLISNRVEYLDCNGNQMNPYWYNSMEEYIKISAQRWYAPRFGNVHYNHGAYLRLKVNGEGVSNDSMEPAFKVIQALYNRANNIGEEDILSGDGAAVKTDPVHIKKYLMEQTAGIIAYAKVTRELLGMCAPYNKPEPYLYFNCEIRDEEANKPVVCFTRKPGMIVSYENVGPWTSNIASTVKEEYILAVFVLYSENSLKNSPKPLSLEEYVRRSEMADHTSWGDWSEGSYNPRIVTKVQNGVNRIIGREFAPAQEVAKPKENSGLGKLFGDMLLPPEGFGKRPNAGSSGNGGEGASKKRGYNFKADSENIKYLADRMIIPVLMQTASKKKISSTGFEMLIDTEAKKMSVEEWESKMGLGTPFEIEDCMINISAIDGETVRYNRAMGAAEKSMDVAGFTFRRTASSRGTCCGISISSDIPRSFKIKCSITVRLKRKDVKPTFVFNKEGV